METSLPQEIVQFIRGCIDRLGTLEVLLLLHSSAGRAWTIQQMSDEMRSSPLAVESSLDVLTVRGLVSLTAEGYLFRPRTAERAGQQLRSACLDDPSRSG